jgi:hypothetical protein
MAEESSTNNLPEPIIKNGRFYHPWDFRLPRFSELMKFVFREKDNSGIPSNQQVTRLFFFQDLGVIGFILM